MYLEINPILMKSLIFLNKKKSWKGVVSSRSAAMKVLRLPCYSHLKPPAAHRHFATKYTAKITSSSPTGRSVAVVVTPPATLPVDSRGYALPRRDLICRVIDMLLHRNPHSSLITIDDRFSDLSSYFQSLSVSLTPAEASEILKSLNSPDLALQFFHRCSSLCPKFRHDAFTYSRILLMLSHSSSSKRIDQVREILSQMDRDQIRGTISTVNILIKIFSSNEDLELCTGLIKKWDLRLNAYTYRCLLQAHIRSRDSDRAFNVYMEMWSKGYQLDIFAYNMLLDALAKDEQLDRSYKVFKDMKLKHCNPDEYTYTIMIRMTGKMGRAEESLALFEEMLTKGCTPNLIAYNTMIQALSKSGMVDKAILLFCNMIKNNCRPNEFTYSIILNVLVAEGQLGRLDEVLEVSNKFINKSIYAYLVRTLSKLGHSSEAHRLFCNMWSFHDGGDRDAYISMLESLCRGVLSTLGKLKQVSHLHDLYEKMKQDGPFPDIFTYNILISSLGRVGKVKEAVEVFEELESSDCKPDIISYNSLINCLGKNGDVDEAHMRFLEMQDKGLNPDVVTYSTLIECFGKTDKVEMARSLFDRMITQGCCPNIVTYNILLDCLERAGRTAETVDLYAKLREQGLTPDSITYAILDRLQSGSNRKFRVRRQNPITGWVVSPLR
ncbi:hypothetical protein Csa_016746 [Cucumis sativus]|nr:hypothetical protein Csa_016746 [Cucumis sativus]